MFQASWLTERNVGFPFIFLSPKKHSLVTTVMNINTWMLVKFLCPV